MSLCLICLLFTDLPFVSNVLVNKPVLKHLFLFSLYFGKKHKLKINVVNYWITYFQSPYIKTYSSIITLNQSSEIPSFYY